MKGGEYNEKHIRDPKARTNARLPFMYVLQVISLKIK